MRSLACLLGLALLGGCASMDRSAGGSSYETENAVTVRFVQPDGSPAAKAVVRVRALGYLDGDPYDSALDSHADSGGHFSSTLPPGAWRLEALQNGHSALVDVPAQGGGSDLGTSILASYCSVRGISMPGATVYSSGLQHRSLADSLGRFRIDSLPAGVHVLRETGSDAQAFIEVAAGDTGYSGPLRLDTAGQILIDDFEDGDSRSRYGPWTGDGWWWVGADSTVTLLPDSASQYPIRAIVPDDRGGHSLHFSAAFPAGSASTAWAQCGVDLGPQSVDLSGLTSLRFLAKGSGFLTVILDIHSATPSQVLEATVALDSAWSEISIPVASFRLPSWSGSSVDAAGRTTLLKQVDGLTWSLGATGELWLDEIHLIGPSTSVLWGSRPPP
jgi:hypothetical protein